MRRRSGVEAWPGFAMLFVLGGACVLGTAGTARGFSGGIPSTAFGSAGCNQVACHSGGMAPEVRLSGPLAVEPLSTHEYTFEIVTPPGQPFGGLNVRADGGTLARGGTHSDLTRTLIGAGGRTEVTHEMPKPSQDGVVRFSFLWTAPASGGPFRFTAWGNAVNGNRNNSGDRAAMTTLEVVLGVPSPTPTPSPSRTPTAPPTPTRSPSATATSSPTPSPTSSPTPAEPDARWDANCDGEVSAADLLAWVKILGGVDPACPADPDCDGRAGEEDLSALVRVVFDAVLAGTPCPLAAM